MTKLHVFDMDGTLLRGSACLEVSRHLGHLDAVHAVEDAWGRGEVGHVEFYELLLELWQGLTDDDIDEVFGVTAWLDGIQEVWADIAQRGEHSAVISLSPQFFVDRLLPWGAASVHGAGVHPATPLDATLVLSPEAKVTIVTELLERYGLTESDCVAYGDSSSDVPLFQHLRNTVAVNGSEAVRAVAAAHYDGSDLREAYALGRALLDGHTPAAAPHRPAHREQRA
jgi:phosphoserine phosphatase